MPRLPLLPLLVALALAGPARASSDYHPTPEGSIREAQSVVVARFSGGIGVTSRELVDQFDEQGRPIVVREALTAFDVTVEETLAGVPITGRLQVTTIGGDAPDVRTPRAFQEPARGARVVLGVVEDRSHPGRFWIAHARAFEADTAAQLEQLRGWVAQVRAGTPMSPEESAELLREVEHEETQSERAAGPKAEEPAQGPSDREPAALEPPPPLTVPEPDVPPGRFDATGGPREAQPALLLNETARWRSQPPTAEPQSSRRSAAARLKPERQENPQGWFSPWMLGLLGGLAVLAALWATRGGPR